jgi:hypothetical protein
VKLEFLNLLRQITLLCCQCNREEGVLTQVQSGLTRSKLVVIASRAAVKLAKHFAALARLAGATTQDTMICHVKRMTQKVRTLAAGRESWQHRTAPAYIS